MIWGWKLFTGVAVLAASACGAAVVATSPPWTPSSSAPQTSPFTGEQVSALHQVLAVKIDNIVDARPPTGLAAADIVFILPVEGGLSRIMAVFSSHVPKVIGPVRSARETDLQLLREFGRPAFAYSGAAPPLVPVVHHSRLVDLRDSVATGYYRDNTRLAPHNLYASGPRLFKLAKHATVASDIGFRFGPPPPGGHKTGPVQASYAAATFAFTWHPQLKTWLVNMDGKLYEDSAGRTLSADTVVIQHVKIVPSRFEEWGGFAPYAQSVGQGKAQVLRDGKTYSATWSRSDANSGTEFTAPDGSAMTFAKGPVWVVLAAS